MEQINQDYHKAFKIYQTACDEYKFGHSCQRVGSYLFAGKSVERDVVRYQTNRSQFNKAISVLTFSILSSYHNSISNKLFFRIKLMSIGEKAVTRMLQYHMQKLA